MSVIDPKLSRMSPAIWDGNALKPQARSFVLGVLKHLYPEMLDAYVIGSITTMRYTPASDFDVDVVIPEKSDIEPAKTIADRFNDTETKVPGSTHVLKVQPVHESDRQDDISKATGAYDLISKQWIKKPVDVGVNPQQYEKEFQSKIQKTDIDIGELNRDLRDIKIITQVFEEAPPETKKQLIEQVEQKKQEIESDIEALVADYDEFRQARLRAFDREMSTDPGAANKYYQNQLLPGPVIFKMMERYGYRELLTKLRDILGRYHSGSVESTSGAKVPA